MVHGSRSLRLWENISCSDINLGLLGQLVQIFVLISQFKIISSPITFEFFAWASSPVWLHIPVGSKAHSNHHSNHNKTHPIAKAVYKSRDFHGFLWQAAGVKRLLFCGVGCQVQGVFLYLAFLPFLLVMFYQISKLLKLLFELQLWDL